MKKIIVATLLILVFSITNATELTGASIKGERINKGQSYGAVIAKLGQPDSVYDYKKNVNGQEVSVREATYVDGSKTYTVVVENGKIVSINSVR
jgi:hypothetical protein